jgi:hypothetical protein
MNHLKKLKAITGKEFLYDNKHTVINDYEIDEEGLHLKVTVTGKDTEMLVPISDAYTFFNNLLPVDSSNSPEEVGFVSQQSSLVQMRQQLIQINSKLMSDSANVDYIRKAKAINNNINTLINSLKLEFMVAKEIRRNQNK